MGNQSKHALLATLAVSASSLWMQVCERQRGCCHELVETFSPLYILRVKTGTSWKRSGSFLSLQILLPSVTIAMVYFSPCASLCSCRSPPSVTCWCLLLQEVALPASRQQPGPVFRSNASAKTAEVNFPVQFKHFVLLASLETVHSASVIWDPENQKCS